jgi:hypothetical protein
MIMPKKKIRMARLGMRHSDIADLGNGFGHGNSYSVGRVVLRVRRKQDNLMPRPRGRSENGKKTSILQLSL